MRYLAIDLKRDIQSPVEKDIRYHKWRKRQLILWLFAIACNKNIWKVF